MSNHDDREQGRFEGRVLESLDNIAGVLDGITGTLGTHGKEIGELKTGQAVHKGEHKRIDQEIKRLKNGNGDGSELGNGSLQTGARIFVPTAALVAVLYAIVEIVNRVFF